jgi:hypothetical protein
VKGDLKAWGQHTHSGTPTARREEKGKRVFLKEIMAKKCLKFDERCK